LKLITILTKYRWLIGTVIFAVLLLGIPLHFSSMIFAAPQLNWSEALAQPHAPAVDPPQPFFPYGTVKVNGLNVPDGTQIGGWCLGVLADEEPSQIAFFEGSDQSLYTLEIDDTTCPSGSTITFTINGLAALENTIWVQGDARVDLTSVFAVSLTNQVSMDGSTWLNADTPSSAAVVAAYSNLQWRFTVTNTSAVTVSLSMTSTIDGVGHRPLEEYCVPQLPAELGPAGLSGDSVSCQFSDAVWAGSNSNTLTATIQSGLWTYHTADPAYSFGYELGLDVDKKVFDGTTWHDADTPAAYPELVIGEELLWQMAVTNTSNITVSLLVTDVLDASMVDLTSLCVSPPPSSLAPWGSVQNTYICQIADTVAGLSHVNTLTATASYQGTASIIANKAGYTGIEGYFYIYIPVILR
jgi:hypothetical protein